MGKYECEECGNRIEKSFPNEESSVEGTPYRLMIPCECVEGRPTVYRLINAVFGVQGEVEDNTNDT